MKVITPEAWYGDFEAYNTASFPIVLISWFALIICTFILFTRPNNKTNILIKTCLALIFAWQGIVFFFTHMTSSAIPGGIPMIIIAILFVLDIFRNKIEFKMPETLWHKYLTIFLIIWALGLYTVATWLTGHSYPRGPFLLAPCPLTIFTIALLSTSIKTMKIDKIPFTLLYVLLLWWSFFSGIFSPLLFGFYVDLSLFLTGVYGLIMLIKHWRAS